MATRWVRADGSGDNTNSGTNYTEAWSTIQYALQNMDGLGAGNTLNVVNDGTHTLTAYTNNFWNSITGSSWTNDNWGFRMRGVDSDGDPALAEIQIPNTNGTYTLLRPQVNSSYFLFEGLEFTEASGVDANASISVELFELGGTAGLPIYWIRNCAFKFGNTQQPASNRWLINYDTSSNGSHKITECYIRNANGAFQRGGAGVMALDALEFTDNVIVNEYAHGNEFIDGLLNSGDEVAVERNTYAVLVTSAATRITGFEKFCMMSAANTDITITVRDNLVFWGQRGTANNLTGTSQIPTFFGTNTGSIAASPTVDYNAFVHMVPNTALVQPYPYDQPITASNTDTYNTNDVSSFDVTSATTIFEDITAAYSWAVGDYTINLDYDLRPKLEALRTGASDGFEFGALPIIPDVVGPGVDPVDVIEYIDTAPFFKPDLRVATEIRYKSVKNRRKFQDLANYTEKLLWEESTHRILNLATNTTTQITLGGVAEAEYLIVETDSPIKVSINDNARYWPVSGVVAVALTAATTVYLKNESTTDSAQVILAVSD